MAKSKSKTASRTAAKAAPKKSPGKAPGKALKGAQKVKAKVAMKAAPKKSAAKSVAKLAAKPAAKSGSAKAKSAPKVNAMKSQKPKLAAKSAPKSATAKAASRKSDLDLSSVFMPLDDRVLVQKAEPATRTPGGLFIPDTVANADRSRQGLVVAVGRGRRDKKGRVRPLDVQLGDTVMFGSGGGSDLRIDEQDLLCLREDEIIAVLKSE